MSLEVKNVFSGYGQIEILHGVSVYAEKSKITCIIGPNGAGKSTLLKTIFGILTAKEGSVVFNGEDITSQRSDKILRRGISYIPQGRSTFPYLTVQENLKIGAYIEKSQEAVKQNMEEIFDKFTILRERKNKMAGTLSGGEQRMLEFGRALMLRPKALLLDEPSMGLAPKIVDESFKRILELNEMGMTILMVEQNVRKGLSISDHAYILVLGKNVYEGCCKDMLNAYSDILKNYLGG